MSEHKMVQSSFPSISVAIPNHNDGQYLAAALESVCTQDPPPCELVVFDDCSTDNSPEIVESFARRFGFVRLVRYPRKSADWQQDFSANVKVLSGDYILSLGADDYLYPGLIRTLGEMICRYPQCGIFFANWNRVDRDGKVIQQMSSGVDSPRFLDGPELASQICKFDIFESGVGSIARKDLLLWIVRNGIGSTGSYHDSMGAPVIAMKHGACYVPAFLAAVQIHSVPGRSNYANRAFADLEGAGKLFENLRRFFGAPEISAVVPAEVLEVLETKAMFCFDFPGRGKVLWRRVMDRARTLILRRSYEQADLWLRRVVQIFPNQAEAFFAWGVVQHKLGRLAEEEFAFRRAVELNPRWAAAHSNLGTCRQRQGSIEDAIAAYQRSNDADPTFAEGFSNLGNLFVAQCRWQDALKPLQRAAELSPQAAAPLVQLGNAFLALDRTEEALAVYRKAVQLDPQLSVAMQGLAAALRRIDQKAGLDQPRRF